LCCAVIWRNKEFMYRLVFFFNAVTTQSCDSSRQPQHGPSLASIFSCTEKFLKWQAMSDSLKSNRRFLRCHHSAS